MHSQVAALVSDSFGGYTLRSPSVASMAAVTHGVDGVGRSVKLNQASDIPLVTRRRDKKSTRCLPRSQ